LILDKIIVDEEVFLSPVQQGDEDALVEHLQDKEIHDNTCVIPFPHTYQHAQEWIETVQKRIKERGITLDWAIRISEEKLIGCISFHGHNLSCMEVVKHTDEIGYWLARPYRGKGITTKVVKKVCEIGFEQLGLVRIEAPVFAFNDASLKVLEKVGFQLEGIQRKCYFKNGKFIDGKMYALVK